MSKQQNIHEKIPKICIVMHSFIEKRQQKNFQTFVYRKKNEIVKIARNANVYTTKILFLFEIVLFIIAK